MNALALVVGWIVIGIALAYLAAAVGRFIGRLVVSVIMVRQWRREAKRYER